MMAIDFTTEVQAKVQDAQLNDRLPGEGFAERLAEEMNGRALDEQREMLREKSRELVASAFLAPLFAQLRDSPWKTDRFNGGMAEDTFGQQLDTILADRMVGRMDGGEGHARAFPMVEAIYKRFESHLPPVTGGLNVDA